MNSRWWPALRAMAWKETRENSKWAALGLLGLALSLAYAVARGNGNYDAASAFQSVWNTVPLVLTIGAPLIGLALGLLQILPESRRDQWAFLVHRPASRGTLFWGKVIAGVSLYLLATLLPLLGVGLWAQIPGSLPAPFDWGLTLGGLGAILSGLAFYFAGLLTALRPARWYGSRALPVVAAVACALLVAGVTEFRQAVLVVLLFLALLVSAAWGSFLTTGVYSGQPRAAKFGLGAALYTGIVLTAIGILAFGGSIVSALLPSASPQRNTWTDYGITRSGRVVHYTSDGRRIFRMTDLQGRPVAFPNPDGSYTSEDFLQEHLLCSRGVRESGWLDPNVGYTRSDRYILTPYSLSPGAGEETWYYVFRLRQLVGYNARTHRLRGYLGPNGFSESAAGAGQFPGTLTNRGAYQEPPLFLQFSHALYLVDAVRHRVTPLLATPSADPIRGASQLGADNYGVRPEERARRTFAVTTSRQVQVFSSDGRPLFTLPREHDPRVYSEVSAAMTPDGSRYFFQYDVYRYGGNPSRLPALLTETTATGAVVQRDVLPTPPPSLGPPPSLAIALFGLLVPPAVTIPFGALGYAGRHGGAGHDIWLSMSQYPPVTWAFCALTLMTGLLSAAGAWLIGRRSVFTRGGQWAWAVGAFWLGPWGVLLLLSLRDWPAREPCPNCGRLRVVDRDRCEHCGAPFAAPVRDGTEIFDEEEREAPGPLVAAE